jgi:TRAP-type mannitol/chloroaromatic compound transport system substrate-binding protein
MSMRVQTGTRVLTTIAVACVIAFTMAGCKRDEAGKGATSDAKGVVRWKMPSAFGSKLPHLGTSAVRFVKNVEEMSDGKFIIQFFEPGALVPGLECFDPVSKGSVEACWTTPGYDTGKFPAAAFFTTVPFGPGFGEFMAWKMFGGGNELRDELYGQHNMKAIDCFAIGPETSGWFRKEIKSTGELRGMKMRFFGLVARVMQKMGVSTQLLAAGDIYPALERGVIDATEFSMPTMDIALGFHQVAKFNYFPGWHQQVSVSHLLMNKQAYEGLSKQNKAILHAALNDAILHTYVETEAKQFGAMKEMADKHAVKVRRWPDSTLAAYEKAWNEVVAEESAKDPLFKKVADSYFGFRKQYQVWLSAQKVEPTYLK